MRISRQTNRLCQRPVNISHNPRRGYEESGRQSTVYYIHETSLDDFKRVNDTHGHAIGDKLLTMIGRRLANVLDDNCVLARMGGDEFALVHLLAFRVVACSLSTYRTRSSKPPGVA